MVLVVYLISRRSENKRRLRKIDFCFTGQCDRPWILQLQIYHRIQFQKWQFLYWFLVIITSWNADSCPYRQRETKIVCKFVYKKKKRKKETIYAIIWLRGVEGKKFLNTPTVLWPAHTMVGHKLKFFSEKRSLFSNHHRIISFSIQYRAVWRKWTPVKKMKRKCSLQKKKKVGPLIFCIFWSLRFAAQKWLFISFEVCN
jgi:hypothetical protein